MTKKRFFVCLLCSLVLVLVLVPFSGAFATSSVDQPIPFGLQFYYSSTPYFVYTDTDDLFSSHHFYIGSRYADDYVINGHSYDYLVLIYRFDFTGSSGGHLTFNASPVYASFQNTTSANALNRLVWYSASSSSYSIAGLPYEYGPSSLPSSSFYNNSCIVSLSSWVTTSPVAQSAPTSGADYSQFETNYNDPWDSSVALACYRQWCSLVLPLPSVVDTTTYFIQSYFDFSSFSSFDTIVLGSSTVTLSSPSSAYNSVLSVSCSSDLLTFSFDIPSVGIATVAYSLSSGTLVTNDRSVFSFAGAFDLSSLPPYLTSFLSFLASSFIPDYTFQQYWDLGYSAGFSAGVNSSSQSSYSEGYSAGLSAGADQANSTVTISSASYQAGYQSGLSSGTNNDYSFFGLISAVVDAPLTAFTSLLNFDFLGVNLYDFVLSILGLALTVFLIKKFL